MNGIKNGISGTNKKEFFTMQSDLTKQEQQLLNAFRQLPPHERWKLLGRAEQLAEQSRPNTKVIIINQGNSPPPKRA